MLERLERRVLADRTGALLAVAFGAQAGLPNFADERARFDALLCEEPRRLTVADVEDWELRRVLGVA